MRARDAREAMVKILDRYIFSSIAATFLFGVAMFMALLMAMELLPDLIKLIAEQGVAPGMALAILGYQIPGLLVYAFPMSMLLCILLVFNRMSADSEMVAIRAGGISFIRIVVPALLFALVVTAVTYVISDRFMPHARHRSLELRQQALQSAQTRKPISFLHIEDGRIVYGIVATHLDVKGMQITNAEITIHENGAPVAFISAPLVTWDPLRGHWEANNATVHLLRSGLIITPSGQNAHLAARSYLLQLKESPFELDPEAQKPENLTAEQLRYQMRRLAMLGAADKNINEYNMELLRRYSVPFSCLVFALIGAPLGLRHHRTSSAVGLGVSLLLILIYYFVTHLLAVLGENGAMIPWLAAWLPNVLGAGIGVGLMLKANQ